VSVSWFRNLQCGRVIMRLTTLKEHVGALERAFAAAGKPCTCRIGTRTLFHTADELAKLMEVPCPAHGFRDLGDLRQVPKGLPLHPEDHAFCSCAPSPVREFLQGRRGPLTDLEQKEEEQRWERESCPDSDEKFRCEQARIERLLRKYEHNKLRRGSCNG
jgi:hypothetical protein